MIYSPYPLMLSQMFFGQYPTLGRLMGGGQAGQGASPYSLMPNFNFSYQQPEPAPSYQPPPVQAAPQAQVAPQAAQQTPWQLLQAHAGEGAGNLRNGGYGMGAWAGSRNSYTGPFGALSRQQAGGRGGGEYGPQL